MHGRCELPDGHARGAYVAKKSAIPCKQHGALALLRGWPRFSSYSCLVSLSANTDLGTAPIC